MGDLQQGRIAIRPYNVRKHTHTMPMMFFVYLHICERPENTRVGANCNSPSHMGELKTWVNLECE